MIIYRGVVLSTTILKGKGKESKERKKVFTFHFDFRGENMFFFFYSMQETITFFECLASLLAEKREQWSSKLDCVTNNSKTKKYNKKKEKHKQNHSFLFLFHRPENVIIVMIESRIQRCRAALYFISTDLEKERGSQKKAKQCNNERLSPGSREESHRSMIHHDF